MMDNFEIKPEDGQLISAWGKSIVNSINLEVLVRKDDPSRLLSEFCKLLAHLAPNIVLRQRQPVTDERLPAIQIGDRLRYHGIPLGPELPPFLDAMSGKSEFPGVPHELEMSLSKMTIPARFSLYISPQCPFCPKTVRQMFRLLQMTPAMRLAIIDAALFPDEAKKADVKSVPTLIMDDRFRWTGDVQTSELARIMLDRDPVQLSALSLRGIIEEGKSTWVVDMMVSAGELFPALFELLVDEKWPVRLGAMVTFENLNSASPRLGAKALDHIKAMLPATPAQIQGDLIYLMGEMGDLALASDLRRYKAPSHPESIREAASDAIESILTRNR